MVGDRETFWAGSEAGGCLGEKCASERTVHLIVQIKTLDKPLFSKSLKEEI